MTEKQDVHQQDSFFGDWKVVETIGHGSYGTVYKVAKEELYGPIQTSAVKIITLPTEAQFKDAEIALGTDRNTLTAYFEDMIKQIVREIDVLGTLGNYTNIIGYKDHKIIKHEDGFGWDILIRMEYATPLRQYKQEHLFSVEEGIRLGIDILSALELCETQNIIHRDIKDDNIFVNSHGIFKLGDFGIAKQIADGGGTATRGMGTPWYMAPEVYAGKHYDHRADLYSLGIVLYRYFNNECMPFVPKEKPNTAFELRMSGTSLPAPINADDDIAKIILKACAFHAEDRYVSAAEMKQALTALLSRENAAVNKQKLPIDEPDIGKQELDPTDSSEPNSKTQSIFGSYIDQPSGSVKQSNEKNGDPDDIKPRGKDDQPPQNSTHVKSESVEHSVAAESNGQKQPEYTTLYKGVWGFSSDSVWKHPKSSTIGLPQHSSDQSPNVHNQDINQQDLVLNTIKQKIDWDKPFILKNAFGSFRNRCLKYDPEMRGGWLIAVGLFLSAIGATGVDILLVFGIACLISGIAYLVHNKNRKK